MDLGAAVRVRVSEVAPPLSSPIDLASPRQAAPASTRCTSGCCDSGRRWAACVLTLLGVVLLLCWMLPALLAQALGMLGVYFLMPRVMVYVYPTRLGMVHVLVFRLIHRLTMGGRPHSRSVKVDCVADGKAWPYEDDAPEREWGLPPAGGAPAEDPAAGVGEPSDGSAAQSPPNVSSPAAGSGQPGRASIAGAATPYTVHTVAVLLDNYCYVIVDTSGCGGGSAGQPGGSRREGDSGGGSSGSMEPLPCALVDPADPPAVLRALSELSRSHYGGRLLLPTSILTTHKHWDHAAGNSRMIKLFPSLAVYGGRLDRVRGCTHPLGDGDTLLMGRIPVTAIAAPGHTVGSTCFLIRGTPCTIFGGDVLFCGGCGAPFEGTVEQMCATFAKLWRACPADTLLFPGHEYTLSVLPQYLGGGMPMPDSPDLWATVCAAVWRAKQLRSQNPPCPTVPLFLADELRINDKFGPLRRAAAVLLAAWRARAAGGAADAPLPPVAEGAVCEPCGEAEEISPAGEGSGSRDSAFSYPTASETGLGAPSGAVADTDAAWPQSPLGLSGLDASALPRDLILVPRSRLRAVGAALVARESHAEVARLLRSCLGSPLQGGMLGTADTAAIASGSDAAPDGVAREIITTRETAEAFALVGGTEEDTASPRWMRARTLVRLLTSPQLLPSPLGHEEGIRALQTTGTEGNGVVWRHALEAAWGVAAPPATPERKGICARVCMHCCPTLAGGLLSGMGASAGRRLRRGRSRGDKNGHTKLNGKREGEAQVLIPPAIAA
jgi:hydroxyacylglutathione hydrolase